ncbi:toll/interleukin-1 receptor domain-containing protein [Aquiflexum sp. TKW24L]|uniref:toll/interleukin-1 receptor domain-containing protein n=1 Tax=Aquiflexum sp. TKW24L TaxID=2942212 RepID=UPI0020C0DD96|nr:toll/interleukin-1 receptor domain-containing protein [Aquiflexum sp. TKW24L]MCL6257463.1 toll/interleukin-1 receptor domain-containing protein [Aquiflexum sp. TKW24L]
MFHAFQSYSHRDGAQDESENWPKKFNNKLKWRIEQISPRFDVNIFFDTRNREINELSEFLKNNLSNSKILLVIESNSYLVSHYCKQELEYFCELHNFSKKNIIKVVKYPPSNDFEEPELLIGVPEYIFYDDTNPDSPLEYHPSDPKFLQEINNLAHDFIKLFRDEIEIDKSKLNSVFLTPNLKSSAHDIGANLAAELRAKKLNIRSTGLLNQDKSLRRKQFQEELSQVILSIHIIGKNNEENDLIEIETARELSHTHNLKVMIWVSNDTELNSEIQMKLKDENFFTANMDIQYGSLEKFKQSVLEEIKLLKK